MSEPMDQPEVQPAPAPSSSQLPIEVDVTTAPPSRRGRRVAVGVSAGVLAIGGLVAAGQLVSADGPQPRHAAGVQAPETSTPATTMPDGSLPARSGPLGGMAFGELSDCFSDALGIDISTAFDDHTVFEDLTSEQLQVAWEQCADLMDGEMFPGMDMPFSEMPFGEMPFGEMPFGEMHPGFPDDLEQTMADLEECFKDSDWGFPGLGGLGLGDADGDGAVAVMTPEELSVLSFGDGDGSITITKAGDDYTISADGDVTDASLPDVFEHGAFDVEAMDEAMADIEARLTECGIDMPNMGDFDMGDFDMGHTTP
jgi:hypothetical protein